MLDLDKFMPTDDQKSLGFDKLNASQRDYLERVPVVWDAAVTCVDSEKK